MIKILLFRIIIFFFSYIIFFLYENFSRYSNNGDFIVFDSQFVKSRIWFVIRSNAWTNLFELKSQARLMNLRMEIFVDLFIHLGSISSRSTEPCTSRVKYIRTNFNIGEPRVKWGTQDILLFFFRLNTAYTKIRIKNN